MNATENETTNPMLNRPYDQPREHSFGYPYLQSQDGGYPIIGTATLQNPRGMPIPWQRWEEALILILELQPLEELTAPRGEEFSAVDNWTVVEEGPTNLKKPEYEIDTIARFRFRLQEAPREGVPAIIGEGTVHEATRAGEKISPTPNQAPLATVQVRIELEDEQDTREILEKMTQDPNTRKSGTPPAPLFGYDSHTLTRGMLDLVELEASARTGYGAYIQGPLVSQEEARRAAPGLEEAVARTIREHQAPEELQDRMQGEMDLMAQEALEAISGDDYKNLVEAALQQIQTRLG